MTSSSARGGLDLAALLRLERLAEDRFRSPVNERNFGGEVFGGQYLGQAVAAALATGDGLASNSMTGYFLSGARANEPLELHVDRVRDGRSFAHRRVQVFQSGKTVFVADVSLHNAEPGQPRHAASAPRVAPPETLISITEAIAKHGNSLLPSAQDVAASNSSVEARLLDSDSGFVKPGNSPASTMWLRAVNFNSDEPLMQYAALAYLSDFWVNTAARITHSPSLFTGTTMTASLNHGIWFHNLPDAGDWLLYELDSPAAGGGTGLSRGLIYARDGRLLASTAQESLVRRPRTG